MFLIANSEQNNVFKALKKCEICLPPEVWHVVQFPVDLQRAPHLCLYSSCRAQGVTKRCLFGLADSALYHRVPTPYPLPLRVSG